MLAKRSPPDRKAPLALFFNQPSRPILRSRTDRRRDVRRKRLHDNVLFLSSVGNFLSFLAMRYLLRQWRHMALTDPMTKVGNKRYFDKQLAEAVASAIEAGTEASLIMLDVDHFKALNDQFGHQTGDEALECVGSALRRAAKSRPSGGAAIARYGGEEFGVILPGVGADEAVEFADALRAAITEGWQRSALTASAGVATYPANGSTPHSLVDAADAAMYVSKRSGRNRTTLAGPAA